MCEKLIKKISTSTNMFLVRSTQANLDTFGWSIGHRADGNFNQSINVQLPSVEAVKSLISRVHGCGIQVAGRNLVIEVQTSHPDAAQAAMSATNLVLTPPETGQSL